MPSPHSNPRLLIRKNTQLVGSVALASGTLTIGRGEHCDIRLDHANVSLAHARLTQTGDGWHIACVDRSAVFVNSQQVDRTTLSPGDVVGIAPFALHFLAGNSSGEVGRDDQSIQLNAVETKPVAVRRAGDAAHMNEQRLRDLYAMARLVLSRKEDGNFWRVIHMALQRCLEADRCVIVGIDDGEELYRIAPETRGSPVDAPLGVSRSVLGDAVAGRKGLLIQQVSDETRYAAAPSLQANQAGSVICVPVVVDGTTRAVVYADRYLTRAALQAADLDFAMAAVDMAAAAVSVDELQARARELARVRGRIEVGRDIQRLLLPSPVPQPAWGAVAAINRPADQMSGDIYDVQMDDQGRLTVSLADVSGKGVPAAFVTAILQSAFRQALVEHDDLHDVVCAVNAALDRDSPANCFATMVICRYSETGDAVEIVNAGHHAPLWLREDGSVDAYPSSVGMPLGITPAWPDEVVQRDARADRVLLLSSDGVTECKNENNEEYGLERLITGLPAMADRPAAAIAQALADDVAAYCAPASPADDVTLVLVERRRS